MTFDGLTDLESDAFTEIINIGMGRAAASLGQMVNEEISLSVPKVEVISSINATQQLADISPTNLSGVTQEFSGTLTGKAMLLFPEDQSLNLVRLLLKDTVPLELMSEMEKEALTEVGNIILNACFGTVANSLAFEIDSTIPSFFSGASNALFKDQNKENTVLMLHVDFSMPSKDIQGFVTFLMDMSSSLYIVQSIKNYVHKFSG